MRAFWILRFWDLGFCDCDFGIGFLIYDLGSLISDLSAEALELA